ncbi:MAG TPA: DUF2182 domain-containing protein [Trichocoleus sp.]|jgi:predicted metal-binding membrane protein
MNELPENSMATSWMQSGRSLFADPLNWAWVLVAAAWGVLLLLAFTGQWHLFHLNGLATYFSISFALKLLIFLAAWQVMTIAMMLPSTLPFARLFIKVSSSQTNHHLVLLAFLAAYLAVWTGFALIAFVGDLGLQLLGQHKFHHQSDLILPIALIAAGLFQFSPLKEQCLYACRHPYSFLTHHYQQGAIAAWKLGIRHGLYCLGCCWALMLVMVSVGAGHLVWMLALTGVMTLERSWKHGRSLVPVVGASLVGIGSWLMMWR